MVVVQLYPCLCRTTRPPGSCRHEPRLRVAHFFTVLGTSERVGGAPCCMDLTRHPPDLRHQATGGLQHGGLHFPYSPTQFSV